MHRHAPPGQLAFAPPPRCAPVAGAPPSAAIWAKGAPVERLLDDVSDIWIGAVIQATCGDGIYDVQYLDDNSVEQGVQADELRTRRLDDSIFPDELWERAGSCLRSKEDLCAFQCIARGPRAAAVRWAEQWWCAAYHEAFGRCGAKCLYHRQENRVAGSLSCAAPAASSSPKARGRWKERFIAKERLRITPAEPLVSSPCNRNIYAASGLVVQSALDGRLRFGAGGGDQYFDPRLGTMVPDD